MADDAVRTQAEVRCPNCRTIGIPRVHSEGWTCTSCGNVRAIRRRCCFLCGKKRSGWLSMPFVADFLTFNQRWLECNCGVWICGDCKGSVFGTLSRDVSFLMFRGRELKHACPRCGQ